MFSCTCYEWDDAPWVWTLPVNDFVPLNASRRKRCKSCGELIDVGEDCLRFHRHREARDEIEMDIHNEGYTIRMADYHHCARCGEIFLNLESVGYCLDIESDMREAMREYWEMTGFDPEKYKPAELPEEK